MKLVALFTIALALLAAQSDPPAEHAVVAIRHWSLADTSRVAVEVTGDFNFRTDRLHNPERVYFDILKARPRFENKRAHVETVSDSLLQKIRVAETVPGITRVVLDLVGDVEITTSKLTNPNRLMIELRRAGSPKNSPGSPTPALRLTNTAPASPAVAVVKPETPKPEPPKAEPPKAEPPKAELSKTESVRPEPVKADLPKPDLSASPASTRPETVVTVPAGPAKPASPPVTAPPALEETAKPARRTTSGDSSLTRALGLKINRVVIDPGHGGHDEGTESPKGLVEKELVLDIAMRVGKLVEEHMGAEVVYTRTDDTFVPLEGRTALANEKKADLFLSIHANSSPTHPAISGVETYYLNFTGPKDAMDVALRENASSQKSVFELQDIARTIALHDKAEESQEFARRIQASLYAFSAKNFPNANNRGVKTAPFVVLIGANMPSVLVEIGFVSNPKEESLLKKPDYRQKLAEALYRGMEKYTEGLSHFSGAVETARPAMLH